jgi:hypothetical protein
MKTIAQVKADYADATPQRRVRAIKAHLREQREQKPESLHDYIEGATQRLREAIAVDQAKRDPHSMGSLITYANHGGPEIAATFVKKDGQHRIFVKKLGVNQTVSISRCQIILNPDG